jgi:hypothetical protein
MSEAEFQALVRDTAGDDGAWSAVRVRAARYLLAKAPWLRNADEALELVDAYHRAPHWLPLLHPIKRSPEGANR